ncbi:putative Transcriptional regulator GerE family [uncultured Desulfobacterium sp.]|uniref:histidine kinase n=1 Tax=uncultured Desulfobacterium sp. TaxID=201089 RepID=A0A445N0F5_9BACT|nr:putative Transcriptional regulator GerE family [uncultured Desulfobacterium sp.]
MINRRRTYKELEQDIRDLNKKLLRCGRTEKQLREIVKKYHSLIETASDLIWEVDLNGVYTFVSPNVKIVLGYDVDEMIGVSFFNFVAPSDIERTKTFFVEKSGQMESFTSWRFIQIHKNGREVIMEVNGTPFFNAEGKLIGWCGFDKDITAKVEAEEALRASENKFRSLVDTTSDWVWEVDINGLYTYASPKAKELLGFDSHEIVGEKLFKFITDEELKTTRSFFKRMCADPKPFPNYIVTQIRKDRHRVITEISGAPVFDNSGTFCGFCGCSKDITVRTLAENELRESEERYRNLFENTEAGVFRATIDVPEFIAVNKKFAEIFGYSTDEILIRPSEFKITDSKELNDLYWLVREKGSIENYEHETVTKGGEKITCIASVKMFPQHNYVEGIIVDITKRKKAEMALKAREAELDIKNQSLEEMNTALRVLLNKRDEDKTELEEKVILNIQKLITPFLDKLKLSKLDSKQASFVNILESNLKDISSPFSHRFSSKHLRLTPAELQISNLIKLGKDSKEIAELLNLSVATIETHRRNIRNKFGLKRTKQNLRTYLSDLLNE